LARGISQLSAAGVKIGVGTDGGGQQGDQFIGWTMQRMKMVMAGIPPQVLMRPRERPPRYSGRTISAWWRLATPTSLLDANPLDGITNSRKISQVYAGAAVDRAKLRRDYERAAELRLSDACIYGMGVESSTNSRLEFSASCPFRCGLTCMTTGRSTASLLPGQFQGQSNGGESPASAGTLISMKPCKRSSLNTGTAVW
jgi:hypothetical protein